jgi:hypothetical protein
MQAPMSSPDVDSDEWRNPDSPVYRIVLIVLRIPHGDTQPDHPEDMQTADSLARAHRIACSLALASLH